MIISFSPQRSAVLNLMQQRIELKQADVLTRMRDDQSTSPFDSFGKFVSGYLKDIEEKYPDQGWNLSRRVHETLDKL